MMNEGMNREPKIKVSDPDIEEALLAIETSGSTKSPTASQAREKLVFDTMPY